MATIARKIEAGLRTNKDSEVETVSFDAGDEVDVVKTWDHFYLVKDAEGHFYNLPKDAITP